MRKRRKQFTNKKKRLLIINGFLVLFLFLGLGYSALGYSLSFFGNVTVRNYNQSLYGVLETAGRKGIYAKEYTGEHNDSMNPLLSTKKIYHWYADNDTKGTEILNKNNVIFAGQCWQMIRTTDTGGVKMIYNGEAENGKCLNTRGTHIGYASRTSQNLASSYWYGTDYTYDKTNQTFKVSGTTEQVTWNNTTGPELVGKYTCKKASVDGTCSTLYLVESYNNASSAYVIPLNSDSNYSQFGKLNFNANSNSPSYVGYMYNTTYPSLYKTMTLTKTILTKATPEVGSLVSDTVDWNNTTPNKYTLLNPVSYGSLGGSINGKYFCDLYHSVSSCVETNYIVNSDNYYVTLENGNTIEDYDYSITYGDSYTANVNGTYTINNPTIINGLDWYTSYINVGAGKYVCENAPNGTCSELWYTTSTTKAKMTYIIVENNYKYAKGFTWDGSKYVLDNDTSVSFWNINDSTNKTSINNAHYTCWNETGECTTISYIYYINEITPYYINITNGKSVEDAKNEMLYNNDVNQINSTIKTGVDAWYKHYLLEDYDDFIEDTIFCNDRSIRALNGWNPDGGSITALLQFKEYNVTSDLSCTNTTDKFSVSNNNAKLTYKVGLMSSPEANLLNNSSARKTGQWYWLASPYFFNTGSGAFGRYVDTNGGIGYYYVNYTNGVRPAISLKPGTEYSSGTGTMDDPYIVSHAKPSTPIFTDSGVVNGTKTVTITFPDGCTNPYSCSYSIDHNTPIPVTESSVSLNFTNPVVLTATVTNGTDEVSKDQTVTYNKLYVSSSGNDTTGNGTIVNPYATISKAYSMADSTSTIYTMSNLTATTTTTFNKNKNITLTSCTKENDTTCNYSTIYTITRGSSFTEGYLLNQTSGTLNMESIKVNGNKVEANRALVVSKGTLNLNSGTTITNSVSSSLGGGVYNNGGTLNITGATISNNSGTKGGGVYNNYNGTVNFNSGSITSNKATDSSEGNGGGIWTAGPTTIAGGTITNNTANFSGGGIHCSYDTQNNNCTMNMTGGTVTKNTADRGGGVFINTDSIFTMSGGTIGGSSANKNTATTYGGGICAKGKLEIKQPSGSTTRISYNTGSSGGGVFSGGTLILTGGTISNNQGEFGGGVYTNSDATISLTGSTISNNTSTSSGGGIYTYGTINMSGGTVSSNTAGTFGGGIMNKTKMTMSGGTITSNKAEQNSGGGIHSDGTITISGGTIIKNSSSTQGGGVSISSGNTAVLSGGTIGGSSENKNTSSYGGGVYSYKPNSVTLSSPTVISYNEASNSGGGVYVSGGTFTMNSGTVNYNSSSTNGGGGIVAANGCSMTLKGGNIRYNTTTGSAGGGGIALIGSSEYDTTVLTINDGTIANNKATATNQGDGGGIYAYVNTKISMSGGTITQNTSNHYGGGILTYGIFNMTGGTISNNSINSSTIRILGGGVALTENATGTINGGSITNNKVTGTGGYNASGGGIAAIESATLSIKQASGKTTEINSNTVTNNSTATGANSTGGGVWCSSPNCTMTGGTISSNKATGGYGGGLYISGTGTFKLSGGSISSNSATNSGGGIYKASAGTFTKSGSPTCTSNGQSGLSSSCVWTAN